MKRECAESVKNVNGVKSVVNNIQIAMATPAPAPVEIAADEPLRASVNDAVKQYDGVEADVKDGVVTLSGTAESKEIKRLAEDICEDILGVRDVENQLRVSQGRREERENAEIENPARVDRNKSLKHN